MLLYIPVLCCYSIVNAKSENSGLHSWLVGSFVILLYIRFSVYILFGGFVVSYECLIYIYFSEGVGGLGVRWYTPLAIRIHTKYIPFRMG